MDRWARWLVTHPRTVLVLAACATLVLARDARQVRFESSLASVLPKGDPAVAYYEETRCFLSFERSFMRPVFEGKSGVTR